MSRIESLRPLNRYLLVVPHVNENQTNTGVLLPDDYKPEEDRFIEATVLDIASDCSEQVRKIKYNDSEDKKIVIDRTMMEKVCLKEKTYHIILENYIVGVHRHPNED
jgi:co-chaperonin GroES (HSP10)